MHQLQFKYPVSPLSFIVITYFDLLFTGVVYLMKYILVSFKACWWNDSCSDMLIEVWIMKLLLLIIIFWKNAKLHDESQMNLKIFFMCCLFIISNLIISTINIVKFCSVFLYYVWPMIYKIRGHIKKTEIKYTGKIFKRIR